LSCNKFISQVFVISLVVFFLAACTSPAPSPISSQPAQTAAAIVNPTKVISATIAAPIRILFIGNSLTFSNNLPDMFAEVAQSGGHEIEVDQLAPGGWTLADHAQSSKTLEEIKQGNWDFVVLQEQSKLPAIPNQRDEQMYPAVRLLEEKINESGAEGILFMTWGSRDGLPESGYEDFTVLQSQLEAGYLEIGRELEMLIAPVGIAWQSAIEREPNLNLWQMDGIHPNREGTYLSALVFYALIFQESPARLIYSADLPEGTAQLLQVVAVETVLENLEHWNIP